MDALHKQIAVPAGGTAIFDGNLLLLTANLADNGSDNEGHDQNQH